MLPDPELEDVHRCRHDEGLVFLAGGYVAFERGEIVVDGGEHGRGERHALAARQTGRERKHLPADDVERRARENEEGQPHGEEGAVLDQLTRLSVAVGATGRGRRRLRLRRALDEALHPRAVAGFLLLAPVQHRPDGLDRGHILLQAVRHGRAHGAAEERQAGERGDVLEG
jgi:hypothetical protein